MFDNFSKIYVSVEDLAIRIMHADPDRLLFKFDERILIFLKSDSFYLPSVKTPKMAANPLKKTEIRRYTTEVPAFRPFFQRYGWTLCFRCCKKSVARHTPIFTFSKQAFSESIDFRILPQNALKRDRNGKCIE